MTRQRVPNAELYRDTARQNLLTNGGFEVWQRGNGPYTTNGVFTADRWQMAMVGSDTLSISRDTANADVAKGSVACAACTFTLSGGGGVTQVTQAIRASDSAIGNAVNCVISLSARVRTSTANAVRLGIYNGSTFSYSSFHTGGGAYETLTVSATIAAANISVYVYFAVSCTAYIDNAMLVIGNVAADYAPLHPADDLARCLRYYEKIGGDGNAYPNYAAYMATTGQGPYYTLRFMARKAVNPTLTKVGTWAVTNCGQPSVQNGTPDGCSISSNATSNAVYMYFSAPDATTYITAEANP